jgi:uncharacterized protein YecA (UPF0149 family)
MVSPSMRSATILAVAASLGGFSAGSFPRPSRRLSGLSFAPIIPPAAPRNAPCPCGSGRKYKRCHLGKPLPAEQPTT